MTTATLDSSKSSSPTKLNVESPSTGKNDAEPKPTNDERDDVSALFCDRDDSRPCDVFSGMCSLKDMKKMVEDSSIEIKEHFSRPLDEQSAVRSRSTSEITVTRKEIFSLSETEGARFVAAVKKLMKNNMFGEPETSEWFRIAGYHGWPSDYCSHGEETFPSWHRAYLLEMETALRKADKALGNDGKIGFPYWDWVKHPSFPPIIRKHFSELPPSFFKSKSAGASIALNRRNSDETIELNLRNADLERLVEESLGVDEHWKHASTRWRQGSSIESPHNSVHVAIGYPMSTVAHAAFDPVFWLHHANIDRIHEAYLMRHPDSRQEFSATQRRLAQERGEDDRFTARLDPFVHPKTGKPFLPTDSFELKDLGYRYADTMEPSMLGGIAQRALSMFSNQPPQTVHCLFRDIKALALKKKSYMLYVLVFPNKEKAAAWNLPSDENLVKALVSMPEFAGIGAVFGGKGSECSNCQTRKPYNLFVDVTKAIQRQEKSAFDDFTVRVATIDEIGAPSTLENTPIPSPELIPEAPDINGAQLKVGSKGSEIRGLQQYLSESGVYTGKVDREFGPKTDLALRKLQTFHGLQSDGVAGPVTKELLTHRRYDAISNVSEDKKQEAWITKTGVKYWLGVCPGYLDRALVLRELLQAFDAWKDVCDVDFVAVEDENEADVKIQFVDDINDASIGSPTGGALGRIGKKFIHIDATQRWIVSDDKPSRGEGFQFQPAILHLIGHLLGFGHVSNKSSVMHPIYNSTKTNLNAVDRAVLCSRGSF
jgi:peptidoglycan hydrolase-like protein with peptidoglycan-binding domain